MNEALRFQNDFCSKTNVSVGVSIEANSILWN